MKELLMVNYEKELQIDDAEETIEVLSPYTIDETLAGLNYVYDINGVYIPFKSSKTPKTMDETEELMFKWETVDKKKVHLQISRNNNKDCELVYQWVSKRRDKRKSEPYKALGKPIKRPNIITDEDTSKTGATSLIGKLAKAGEQQGFKLDINDYKEFITGIVSSITASSLLDVFKDKGYILPSDDSTEDYDMVKEINERAHPTLTKEELAEGLEVKAEIKEKGFVQYMNSILDKIHIGDHRNIIRKILAVYDVISGINSQMIATDGNAELGKSYEDETVLSAIPERYIYPVDEMTKASFSRCAEIHERYFDRMICYMGDLGSENSIKEVIDVFNIFKRLITENKYSREVADKIGGKYVVNKFKLTVDSIGVLFQTTKFDFLDIEGDQLASRSLKSTPAKVDTKEVMYYRGKKRGIRNSVTNQRKAEAENEFRKFQSYILYIISKDIDIVNPWITVFMRFAELSKTPIRDCDKAMCLFQAYCTLTYTECGKIGDNEYLATSEQLEDYMNDVSLDNVLPPSESDFLKMLIGDGTKYGLTILDTETEEEKEEEAPSFDPVIGYYDDAIAEVYKGINGETQGVDTSDKTMETLTHTDREEAIATLLQLYRLGGRSDNHEDNVFFTVTDVKRTHQKRKIYKNIEDVPKLLNKLYNNGFMDKLDYKNVKGQNIYYLTSKCEKLMDTIEVTEEDKAEAEKLMNEEWLGNSDAIDW